MNLICLIVLGIVGQFCYEAPVEYNPPGYCVGNVCYVYPEDLQVRVSWYDPALGGINCVEPCDELGDGTPVTDHEYRYVIACPKGLYGLYLDFPGLHETRQCRDHGGDIKPTCREIFIPAKGREYTCYVAIDFMLTEEPFYAYTLQDWTVLNAKKSLTNLTMFEKVQ